MLIVVINNMECPVCGSPQPHVYQDKYEQLICLGCRAQDKETVVKLENPGVVIGRYIQN